MNLTQKSRKRLLIKFAGFILFIILLTVWIKRKEIVEMEISQKKMEIFKALYNKDIDSAKLILEEVIDSSFYLDQ